MLASLLRRAGVVMLGVSLCAADTSVTFQDAGTSASAAVAEVSAYTSSLASSSASWSTDGSDHVQYQIRSGAVASKGVCLGSWLVAEYWMTSAADFWTGATNASEGEYTAISQASDPDTIRSNLEYHHSTFITESEIADIAAAGLNTVRVPIGYWIVGFDDYDPSGKAEWKAYTNGTIAYLDALVTDWARKYDVAVLLSVHGAKGSQNGADHSSPVVPGTAYWGQFEENVNNTLALVSYLADRYKDEPAFLGIGLLNEPNAETTQEVLYAYYEAAYAAVRAVSDCVLTIAPLLYEQSPDAMNGFMEAPEYTNVWVEWHPYFVWGYDDVSAEDLITTSVETSFQGDVTAWNNRTGHNRLFIGEWCFSTNNKFTDDDALFHQFAAAQTAVVDQAGGGWTYWAWRLYGDETGLNTWSLRAVLRNETLREILVPGSSSSSSSSSGSSASQQQQQQQQQTRLL
jgi:glucan 1,3-beta-glucosidase